MLGVGGVALFPPLGRTHWVPASDYAAIARLCPETGLRGTFLSAGPPAGDHPGDHAVALAGDAARSAGLPGVRARG